jgi:hypothetical protein
VATQKTLTQRERPVIVSTHADINQLLETMGFDHAFVLLQSSGATATDFSRTPETAGTSACPDRQLILDAHRALCDLNEKNRQLFRNVIELLDGENGDSK